MKSHLTLFSALLGTLLLLSCKSSEKIPLYKNANASIDSRVEDLLGRMTLEEKVAQLCSKSDRFTPTTVRDQAKIDELFADMPGMLQPLYEYLDTIAEVRNTLQRHALEQTRLGIPILFTEEALHGAAKDEATSFPQAVALGSTWNPELLEEVFDIAARELRT